MGENILRIAAISDTHFQASKPHRYQLNIERFKQNVDDMSANADVIVHCGDFTDKGDIPSLEAVADVLRTATVPVVGTLGNHDVRHGATVPTKILSERGGVTILNGDKVTLTHGDTDVTFIGVPGFARRENKKKIRHVKVTMGEYDSMVEKQRARFFRTMSNLQGSNNIVLFHFDQMHRPTPSDEPASEEVELTPFAKLVDEHADQINLYLHGHDHRTMNRPETSPQQVRVYDVAMAIQINMSPGIPYRVIPVELRPEVSTSFDLPSPVEELHYPHIPDLRRSGAPSLYASR